MNFWVYLGVRASWIDTNPHAKQEDFMTEAIIPLLSLIALEVILGIDNIIFISILADKLPEEKRNKLRYWGT